MSYSTKRRTLVGPSDLSSEEVLEESGQNRRIEADICISKRLSIIYGIRLMFVRVESESSILQSAC
jgi:hypothetical protein